MFVPRVHGTLVSGRVGADGFRLRARAPLSNGASALMAYGSWTPNSEGARISVRFVPETVAVVSLASIVALALLILATIHNGLSVGVGLFAIVACAVMCL